MHPITYQKTFTFKTTGESVTLYHSNTESGFFRGLSFNSDGKDILWIKDYVEILTLKSKVNPEVSYINLSWYWDGALPTDTVLMVSTVNA